MPEGEGCAVARSGWGARGGGGGGWGGGGEGEVSYVLPADLRAVIADDNGLRVLHDLRDRLHGLLRDAVRLNDKRLRCVTQMCAAMSGLGVCDV